MENDSQEQPAILSDGIELRKQTLALLMLAGILPLVVLLFYSHFMLGLRMQADAYTRMKDTVEIAERRVSDETYQLFDQIDRVSMGDEYFTKADKTATNDAEKVVEEGGANKGFDATNILERVEANWRLFARSPESLMLLDRDGRTIASTGDETTTFNTKAFQVALLGEVSGTGFWTYFQGDEEVEEGAQQGAEPSSEQTASDQFVSSSRYAREKRQAQGLSTILYYPVEDDSNAVVAVVRLRVFLRDFFHAFPSEGTVSYVTSSGFFLDEADDQGVRIDESEDGRLLTDFTRDFPDWKAANAQGKCHDKNDVAYLYVNGKYHNQAVGNVTMVYMISTEDALSLGKDLRTLFFFVGAGAILLLLFVGFLYAERLVGPIQAAAEAARGVAQGNLGIRLPLTEGPRELRHLASSFNTMTDEVRSNREEMERKIQERTKRIKELSKYTGAILDCMSESLVVVGDDRIHLLNKSATTLLDVNGAETPGSVHRQMRGLFDKTARWDRFRESVEGSGQDGMILLAPSSGDINWLEVHTTPVPGPEGEKARLWLLRDVSDRERLQSELRQIQRQEAIGLLAGGIAHEFNNILTSIQGGLELAKWDTAEGKDPTGSIESGLTACHRASDIVQRLLGFARQQEDMDMKPTQMNDVIRESLDLVEARLDPLIRIERDFDDNLELVDADGGQLVQVLMNLVINASHAMEEDGGRIIIRSFMHDASIMASEEREACSGPVCAIEVEDNGSGMEAAVVERMYDPFFTTKPPGQGTGLGLAICHQIVRSHQGWMACESTPGKGTKFTLYFPSLSNPGRIMPIEESSDPVQEFRSTKSGRILVVDDEPHIRKIAERYLSRMGHSVEEMPDGIEAIKRLESGTHFDLVILDLHMPIISGEETLHRIKSRWPNLPVIIWTGGLKDAPRIYDAPRELQPDAFLAKPFGSKDLIKLVNQTLQSGNDVPPPIPFPGNSRGITPFAEGDGLG